MEIITKNIRWRALMETYQIAKFGRSPNNLSRDIVLTQRCPEEKENNKNKKSKNNRSAFSCRSNDWLVVYSILNDALVVYQILNDAFVV